MGANTEICMRIKNVNMYIQFRCEIKPIPESEQEKYHIQYVTPPHEPRWQKQYRTTQKNTQKHVFLGLTKNIEKHQGAGGGGG